MEMGKVREILTHLKTISNQTPNHFIISRDVVYQRIYVRKFYAKFGVQSTLLLAREILYQRIYIRKCYAKFGSSRHCYQPDELYIREYTSGNSMQNLVCSRHCYQPDKLYIREYAGNSTQNLVRVDTAISQRNFILENIRQEILH